MSRGESRSDEDSVERVAYDVVSREIHRGDGGTSTATAARLREELVSLEVLLGSRAIDLFPRCAGEAGKGNTAVLESPSAEGSEQMGAGHYALAIAAMLVMTVVLLWASNDPVGMPAQRSWRSVQGSDLQVTASVAEGQLRLRWKEPGGVRWYRVSVIGASGALIARRDLDRGCECGARVRLPDDESSLFWLVEGFDDRWNRVAVASGRVGQEPG